MKHYIIAAKAGDKTAFDNIKRVFMECPGLLVTKDEFESIQVSPIGQRVGSGSLISTTIEPATTRCIPCCSSLFKEE